MTQSWWQPLLTRNVERDANGILRCTVSNSESLEFHEKHTKGAYLRKLQDVKFHQVNWESPYYKKVFDAYLEGVDLRDKTILDFGCGDGRFAQYLIEKGAHRIICADFDYKLLVAFSEYLNDAGHADKVLLVHTDIENLPIASGSLDLILSIGVLYYYNEKYEDAIKTLGSWLKPGGLLFTSDPDIEGFILRTLIFESLGEALQTFEQKRFKEVRENTDLRFRAFTEAEMEKIFPACGLNIIERHGISSFHNVLRVLLLRGHITESEIEQNENRIKGMFDFLHDHGRLFKHIVWKLQKPQ